MSLILQPHSLILPTTQIYVFREARVGEAFTKGALHRESVETFLHSLKPVCDSEGNPLKLSPRACRALAHVLGARVFGMPGDYGVINGGRV